LTRAPEAGRVPVDDPEPDRRSPVQVDVIEDGVHRLAREAFALAGAGHQDQPHPWLAVVRIQGQVLDHADRLTGGGIPEREHVPALCALSRVPVGAQRLEVVIAALGPLEVLRIAAEDLQYLWEVR